MTFCPFGLLGFWIALSRWLLVGVADGDDAAALDLAEGLDVVAAAATDADDGDANVVVGAQDAELVLERECGGAGGGRAGEETSAGDLRHENAPFVRDWVPADYTEWAHCVAEIDVYFAWFRSFERA